MEFKNKLERNVTKQYLFTFLNCLDLTRGIWMLYLAYKGLSLFEIGLMETVYHISSFSMEIPTGAIADIFGRKTSRVLGRVVSIIAILIMIFGNNVYMFALSFFFTAMGNNLESGAGDALLYDSLKEIGKEETYLKVNGRNEFFVQITSLFALLLGGYIANMAFESVYKIAFVIAIVSVIQALTFTEPTIGKIEKQHSFIKTFTKQLKDSFNIVKTDKRIFLTIIAFELFSTLYTTEFFYIQNRLSALGSSTFEIGLFLAAGSLFAAILATQAHKLDKRFSIVGMVRIASVVGIICFWGMSFTGIEKYAFIILSGVEGMLFVSIGDYINKLIPSQQRATILSLQSMVFSLFMIVLFPIVGKLGDLYDLGFSFKVVAYVATVVLGVILFGLRKVKVTE